MLWLESQEESFSILVILCLVGDFTSAFLVQSLNLTQKVVAPKGVFSSCAQNNNVITCHNLGVLMSENYSSTEIYVSCNIL